MKTFDTQKLYFLGVMCNILLLLGTLFSNSFFLIPGLLFNMITTLLIGAYSVFIAVLFKKSGQMFYLFLIPLMIFFLMLYLW